MLVLFATNINSRAHINLLYENRLKIYLLSCQKAEISCTLIRKIKEPILAKSLLEIFTLENSKAPCVAIDNLNIKIHSLKKASNQK